MSHELSVGDTAKLRMLTVSYSPVMFEGAIREKFEEAFRDVNVAVRYVPCGDLHDEIVAAMSTGDAEYDVLMIDNAWVPGFVEAGWLTDLTKYVTPEVKQNIPPKALEVTDGFLSPRKRLLD
jgi:ABC-type glycerol-3-phosphate transport system substrate-binding protein